MRSVDESGASRWKDRIKREDKKHPRMNIRIDLVDSEV